jgi:hypothetical protein
MEEEQQKFKRKKQETAGEWEEKTNSLSWGGGVGGGEPACELEKTEKKFWKNYGPLIIKTKELKYKEDTGYRKWVRQNDTDFKISGLRTERIEGVEKETQWRRNWAGVLQIERKGVGSRPRVCVWGCVCVCDVPEWQAEGECQTCEKTQIRQLCG